MFQFVPEANQTRELTRSGCVRVHSEHSSNETQYHIQWVCNQMRTQ